MERRHQGQHGDGCFGCKVHSIQMSPAAMPSRRNNIPPPPPNNAWERGILRDDRGQPIRRGGEVIGLHEYAANRHKIDEQVKALKSGAPMNERL